LAKSPIPAFLFAMRHFLSSVAHDARIAARSLGRSAGFTTAAVLSLGLAIGAGMAGFAVIDAVRFRALPFPNADRLVLISETPKEGCANLCMVNYKTFALLREQKFKSIDAISGFVEGPKSFGTGGDQFDVTSGIVSATLFAMLDVNPRLGRTFSPDEDRLGAAPTMLISHELWQTYFGGDPRIIGKSYRLSDEPFTVIGVMPPGFRFETRSQTWLAASRYLDPRTGTSLRALNVLARLAPGATREQLTGELRSLEAAANEGRAEKARTTLTVAPLRDRYVTATRSHDLIFAAIVSAILVIGCANVASLVLVRATRHRRALAVRSALGAGRALLVRYLVVENMLLCGAGLVLGLLLASMSLGALQSVAPLQSATRVAGMEYRMDLRAAAFAFVLTIIAGVLLSLAPVRLLLSTDLQRTLREGSLAAAGSRGGNRTHQAFVITQTACAVALLIATGLMVRTIARLSGLELGYDAAHVASMTVVPVHSGRIKEKYLPTTDRLLTEIAAIPGVEAVAVRMQIPFAAVRPRAPGVIIVARDTEDAMMTLDNGRPVEPSMQPRNALGVSADYFRTLDIPLVAGRGFTAADNESSPPVAIINEWAAQHWWPKENAVGRTFSIDTAPGARAVVTVVGVIRDNLAGQQSVLTAKPGPEVFRPFKQANFWVSSYYVRSHAASGPLIEKVQKTVMRAVPANGQARGGLLSTQVDDQLQTVRTNATQIAGFAVVGLLLAVTGLYGVLSYVVQQRTQEIGIRAVLGADRARLLAMVLSHAARLTLLGIVVGVVTAVFGMRLMRDLLYGTPTNDPVVYVAVCVVALIVALLASYFPARRASRVDPAIALRSS
jgi:putative ABC transport system permease protein